MVARSGILGQHEWWRGLAVASAAVSLLGLALFGQPIRQAYIAGRMDVITLAALLLLHWPSVSLAGSKVSAPAEVPAPAGEDGSEATEVLTMCREDKPSARLSLRIRAGYGKVW